MRISTQTMLAARRLTKKEACRVAACLLLLGGVGYYAGWGVYIIQDAPTGQPIFGSGACAARLLAVVVAWDCVQAYFLLPASYAKAQTYRDGNPLGCFASHYEHHGGFVTVRWGQEPAGS